jgi:hypothetical protein
MPPGCTFGWNYYLTASGPAFLGPGGAARACFLPSPRPGINTIGFQFTVDGIDSWFDAFNFDSTGYVITANTMLVGRDPEFPLEVATKRYVDESIEELNFPLMTVSPTAPLGPNRRGDMWFNSSTGILSVWNGTDWVATGGAGGGATVSVLPPDPPNFIGELWFDPVANELSIFNGTDWQFAGPLPAGPNGAIQYNDNGAWGGSGNAVVTDQGQLILTPMTVSQLPAPSAFYEGARATVDDAQSIFGPVTGNGSYTIPVFCDGTEWLSDFGVETTPAPSNGSIQFNNNGAFGGIDELVFDQINTEINVRLPFLWPTPNVRLQYWGATPFETNTLGVWFLTGFAPLVRIGPERMVLAGSVGAGISLGWTNPAGPGVEGYDSVVAIQSVPFGASFGSLLEINSGNVDTGVGTGPGSPAWLRLNASTVAQLPAAAPIYRGARGTVNDATTSIGTSGIYDGVVQSGGSGIVPVFCDGTNWISLLPIGPDGSLQFNNNGTFGSTDWLYWSSTGLYGPGLVDRVKLYFGPSTSRRFLWDVGNYIGSGDSPGVILGPDDLGVPQDGMIGFGPSNTNPWEGLIGAIQRPPQVGANGLIEITNGNYFQSEVAGPPQPPWWTFGTGSPGRLRLNSCTVAQLPDISTFGHQNLYRGAHGTVSDALDRCGVVQGGGANVIPVFCDGINWISGLGDSVSLTTPASPQAGNFWFGTAAGQSWLLNLFRGPGLTTVRYGYGIIGYPAPNGSPLCRVWNSTTDTWSIFTIGAYVGGTVTAGVGSLWLDTASNEFRVFDGTNWRTIATGVV